MRICKLNYDYFSKYDEYVRSHKQGLFYYSIKFKQFIEQICNVKSHYLIAIDENNDISGVMPLMIKDGVMGQIINSLPYYGSNGGVLANSKKIAESLYLKYSDIITKGSYSAATYVENPLHPDVVSYDYDYLDERIGQWTCLKAQTVDTLMTAFDSSTRRNIRKSKKQGIDVIVDNLAIDFLKQTHQANMADINGLAKSDQFFDMIPKIF